MAEIKLVMGDPKTKRSFKAEIKGPDAEQLMGKKLGETFRGELIGLPGFEFTITGGSDKAGFPMNSDLEGPGKRRLILAGNKPGFNRPKKFKGIRVRKLVRGSTVAPDTMQINCKITKHNSDIDLYKHFNVTPKHEHTPEGPTSPPKPVTTEGSKPIEEAAPAAG
jgi:small subunit ribosomal protein S6e